MSRVPADREAFWRALCFLVVAIGFLVLYPLVLGGLAGLVARIIYERLIQAGGGL